MYKRQKQFSVTDEYSIPNFSALYKYSEIQQRLVCAIAYGFELQFDITQPLSIKDVTQLNNLIASGSDVDVPSSSLDTVFVLLYHFGYLSVKKITYNMIGTFTIPNEESKSSLARDILKTSIEFYCYTWDHADRVSSAVYSITSGTSADIKLFETILENWFRNLKPGSLETTDNFSTWMFMIFYNIQTNSIPYQF